MRCSTAWRCSSAAWWCGRWQCGGRRNALVRRSSVADERSRVTADGRAKLLLLLLAQRHCTRIQRIQLATRLLATAADLWRGPLRRRLVQRGSLSCVRCPLLRRSWRHWRRRGTGFWGSLELAHGDSILIRGTQAIGRHFTLKTARPEPLTVLSALRVYDTPHQADEDKRQHGVRTDLHGQRRGNWTALQAASSSSRGSGWASRGEVLGLGVSP